MSRCVNYKVEFRIVQNIRNANIPDVSLKLHSDFNIYFLCVQHLQVFFASCYVITHGVTCDVIVEKFQSQEWAPWYGVCSSPHRWCTHGRLSPG